jgi:outer membrane lipoprotein SlyB
MNHTFTHRILWLVPLTIAVASAGTLISACGPQDGKPVAAAATPAQQTPVAPTAPAARQAPVAQPAPAKQAAAAQPAARPAPKPVQPVVVKSANLGAIAHIEPITQADPSGGGAVAGGVLGGVVGHQFGKGDGKKAMTVLGAVGGAVAGHQVEKQYNRKVVGYRVRVQLDNGETKTFEPTQIGDLKVGDRVRVDHGALHKA